MDRLMYLLQSALSTLIALVFFFSLLEYKAKKRLTIFLVAVSFFAVSAFVNIVMESLTLDMVLSIFMLITFCFFFHDWKKASIVASFYKIVVYISEPTAYLLLTLITKLEMPDSVKLMITSFGGIISKLVAGFILYYCSKLLKIAFAGENMPARYWIGCLIIPCMSAFLIYYIFTFSFGGSNPLYNFIPTIIIIIVNAVVLILFIRLSEYFQTALANQKYLEQLDAFNYHQSNVVNTLASIKGVRHDLKNILLSLQASLQEGNLDAATITINENLELASPVFISRTGITTIDSIINYKASEAEASDINIHVNNNLLYNLDLNWIDVGVILSNALDNAIEACTLNDEADRDIQINISTRQKILWLSISNPFSNSIVKTRKGDFISTKQNKDNHGYGIASIKRLVDKNNGECDIDCKCGQFIVSMILPEKQ